MGNFHPPPKGETFLTLWPQLQLWMSCPTSPLMLLFYLFVFKDRFMAFLPLLDSGAVKTDRRVEYPPLGLSVHSEDLPDRALHQTFPAQPHYMW